MVKNLRWTDSQKAIAQYISEGKGFTELTQMGYSKALVSKVLNAVKTGSVPPDKPAKTTKTTTSQAYQQSATRVRDRVVDAVELGTILSMPEDWRLTQHDTFLLLDTFYLAKEELGIGGTMGQFIALICKAFRAMMHYPSMTEVGPTLLLTQQEESDNGRGEEALDGAGRVEQDIYGDGGEGEQYEREN